ncbi:hypothetical protein SAMN05421678_108253 [Actinopolymorpha cephalotaxi]|uniref:Uncharacterized protein n=1 Tax=Actinopolymorpha cephalotaxi TaxID=504797 RepID=A0A1I2UN98_9ACTN|nr:hypothetical protein [Actinopolymorpha cephalotaxi]NYH86667.1 hypothetical protein [Actinopolymorpha cephalotaxi]SFG78625.1 hypothetical protein SAMN05421678_108253 [Actinopolymorpha cephalotaxi]
MDRIVPEDPDAIDFETILGHERMAAAERVNQAADAAIAAIDRPASRTARMRAGALLALCWLCGGSFGVEAADWRALPGACLDAAVAREERRP